MNKRGVALILSFIIIVVLTVLSSVLFSRSISERAIAQRYLESTQAFWLAEAGVSRAMNELRSNYNATGTNLWRTALGQGGYAVDVAVNGQSRDITAYGFIPFDGTTRVQRIVEVNVNRNIPPNFYNNAIYSAGEVDFNGNAYAVTGDVRYAETIENTTNVSGTITQDASISPLAMLDFPQILAISQRQGNVYDEARLKNVKNGTDSFPNSFWSGQGTDGIDNDGDTQIDEADEKVNVVYVKEDLELKGNIGTIGGFFVVVGDVITNPSATFDASINGNGQIQGAIYTRGEFEVNGGGGGGLNINGGVWAGQEAELNGSATVTYNLDYMLAISALNINADVQIISWRDKQNPYYLAP